MPYLRRQSRKNDLYSESVLIELRIQNSELRVRVGILKSETRNKILHKLLEFCHNK